MHVENVPKTKGGDAAYPTSISKQNHDALPLHIEQKHTEPVPKPVRQKGTLRSASSLKVVADEGGVMSVIEVRNRAQGMC